MVEWPVTMSVDSVEKPNGKLKSRRIPDFCAMCDACHRLPVRNQEGEVGRDIGRVHEKVGARNRRVYDGEE